MKQILLIAIREYKQYVFSRGFLLFLALFPVGLVFMSATIGFLEKNKPLRSYVVYDETGSFIDDIEREIEWRRYLDAVFAWDGYLSIYAKTPDALPAPFAPDNYSDRRIQNFAKAGGFDAARDAAAPFLKPGAPAFKEPKPNFERIELPPDVKAANTLEDVEARLRPYLLEDRLAPSANGAPRKVFAAILIPKDFGAGPESPPAQYWSRNLTDVALRNSVEDALGAALRRDAISELGISGEELDNISSIEAPVTAFRPDKAPNDAELSTKDRVETLLPAVMTYMLLVIIFGVGNLLLTNTIEERSNKIVEILLSSVTANQLMMGKLIGIAAVGLTMPTVFLIGGGVMAMISSTEENIMGIAVSALFSSNLLAIYLFYFLCAYFIFAMIFLAIGAVSNSLQDAQSYMGPVMLFVFAPLPFMLVVFQNPNGIVASILTWIPIYTPYAVMMRAASDPPLWEILGATALMLAFAFVLARVMGRIFRQAILQAAPPKMREVWRLAKSEAA